MHWLDFKAHYPQKKDASPQKIAKRKANFIKAHAMIEKHNKIKSVTFQMEHNKFSAMVGTHEWPPFNPLYNSHKNRLPCRFYDLFLKVKINSVS